MLFREAIFWVVLCYGIIRVRRKGGCLFPIKCNPAHHTCLSHHFPLFLTFLSSGKEQVKGSTAPLDWDWEEIFYRVLEQNCEQRANFCLSKTWALLVTIWCASLHCQPSQVGGGAGLLFGVPSLLLLSHPHLHPPHRGKTLVMEEQCRGRARCSAFPKLGRGGDISGASISPAQGNGCHTPSLPCAYCTGKPSTQTRSQECLISLVLALAGLSMPSHPCTVIAGAFIPGCTAPSWGFAPWACGKCQAVALCSCSWKIVHNSAYFSCKTFWVCWYSCRSVDVLHPASMSLQGPHVMWDFGLGNLLQEWDLNWRN